MNETRSLNAAALSRFRTRREYPLSHQYQIIAKKNGIMLVDVALHAQQEEGLSPEDAIYKACTLRFRPISMTTMAALLGGVPMMLGTGAGAEIRQPLGYSIVGGLSCRRC